jgi:hypothetical protein
MALTILSPPWPLSYLILGLESLRQTPREVEGVLSNQPILISGVFGGGYHLVGHVDC